MIILSQDLENRNIRIEGRVFEEKEKIVYDLHVGKSFQKPGDANSQKMPDVYKLQAGHCILLTTKEELSLPSNVFGQLCSKGSLTALGLFVGNTKVDPLFRGRLDISAFNASGSVIEIKKGQSFCSIFFNTIEHDVEDAASRRSPEMPFRRESKLKQFICDHRAQIITAIMTIILSGITAYLSAYAGSRSNQSCLEVVDKSATSKFKDGFEKKDISQPQKSEEAVEDR